MNNSKELLEKIKYENSKSETIAFIDKCSDLKLLHYIVCNYNWDDGLEIPITILRNKYCDKGTALMLFEYADGYLIFENDNDLTEKHKEFILEIKYKIESDDFATRNIMYIPDLSRTQKYKFKKAVSNINEVFINGTTGKELIPIIV